MPTLAQQAIDAALEGNWKVAIEKNKEIIDIDPCDIEALNRLAQASIETGNLQKAKEFCKEVLKHDQYNPIALKKLTKIDSLKDCVSQISSHIPQSTTVFLEEPGKTKIVNLVNLATPQILSQAQPGREVKLTARKHGVVITDLCDIYLGALPDDIAHRLEIFLNGGCKYAAYIKTASKNSLSVFIIEKEKPKKFLDQNTFVANHNSTQKNHTKTQADPDETQENQNEETAGNQENEELE